MICVHKSEEKKDMETEGLREKLAQVEGQEYAPLLLPCEEAMIEALKANKLQRVKSVWEQWPQHVVWWYPFDSERPGDHYACLMGCAAKHACLEVLAYLVNRVFDIANSAEPFFHPKDWRFHSSRRLCVNAFRRGQLSRLQSI